MVCRATNVESKTHPLQARFALRAGLPDKTSLHAEIRALIKVRRDFDTMVIARVNRKGELCLAKPCPVCQLAIIESGVEEVYYSTNDQSWLKFSPGDKIE